MNTGEAQDGSLWPAPQRFSRHRRLRFALIVVAVVVVLITAVLQLIDDIDPRTTTSHGQGNEPARVRVADADPGWGRMVA